MYDASGVKHQAKYSYSTSTSLISLGATTTENTVASSFQTDYCGNYIYQKSGTGSPKLLRILTPEGYISTYLGMISYLGYWTYTYFLKDHLGNTRVNINSDYLSKNTSKAYGASDQIDYYPFGMERSNNGQSSAGCFNSGNNPYLYNGKEIDRMNGLNENDYGGRWYDAAVGEWPTMDPLAEKYYSISPYTYCAGNPVKFIDPNGQSIWINSNEGNGNRHMIRYEAGMDYNGNNNFIYSTVNYLNAINDNGGANMLNILSSSKNSFDFVNKPTTDKNGKTIEGALNFEENKTGGGTIYAGSLMGNSNKYSKIEATSHELFHGLQYELGQGGASVYNEVEATVFSSIIASNWVSTTHYVGAMSGKLSGNDTPVGDLYEQSIKNLTNNIFYPDFVNAILSFQTGSQINLKGIYDSDPIQRSNQTRSILQQFYPKKL